MANDIADWSSSVVVQSGTVAISGTATVTISGTPTVQFAAGQSVSITGTAVVSISGTPNVSISGTPTVILGAGTATVGSISAIGSTVTVAGTVNIGNTPAVTISGTVSVSIVAGTVAISGSPTINVVSANGVSIAGPNLLAAVAAGPISGGWFTSGGVNSPVYNADGSMTMTANVTSSGGFAMATPEPGQRSGPGAQIPVLPGQTYQVQAYVQAVTANDQMGIQLLVEDGVGTATFLGGQLVSTPVGTWVLLSQTLIVPANRFYATLRLVSGSCTTGDQYLVGMASLSNVGAFPMNAQQGTLPTNMPQVDLGQIKSPASGEGVTTLSLPPGTQAIAIRLDSSLYAKYDHVTVRGHLNQPNTKTTYFTAHSFNQEVFAFPVLSTFDSQVEVAVQNNDNATVVTVEVVALLQSVPEFLELFPQPQLEPNQPPGAILKTLAANVAQWLIPPVAGVAISLFEIVETYTTNFGAGDIIDIGHATVLPASQATDTGVLVEIAPMGASPFAFPFHGAQLPRGHGVYVICALSAAGNFGCEINYSLS